MNRDEGSGPTTQRSPLDASCPVPLRHERVQLGHGGGGQLTRELLERVILPALGDRAPATLEDAAALDLPSGKLALSTDAYVVSPLFFPGGDIGKLAVVGTVNDLAMGGARAHALSAAFVLEEGLPIETLARVVRSMSEAARAVDVRVVAGDTKVVERGRADGLYLTTTGLGVRELSCGSHLIRPGDAILLSGDVGRHGFAILAERHGLGFEPPLDSDCADLSACALALGRDVELHCMRDLTRGGLVTALCELSSDADLDFELEESQIPICEPVRGAAELLGLDPLQVANEGRFAAFVPQAQSDAALAALRAHAVGQGARAIGRVSRRSGSAARVSMQSLVGGRRLLAPPSGEQLPRIC